MSWVTFLSSNWLLINLICGFGFCLKLDWDAKIHGKDSWSDEAREPVCIPRRSHYPISGYLFYYFYVLNLFAFTVFIHTEERIFHHLCFYDMAINVQLGCSIYTPTINSNLHQHAFKLVSTCTVSLSLEFLPLTLGFLFRILNGIQKLVILGIKPVHPLMSQLELNICVWHIAQRPKTSDENYN